METIKNVALFEENNQEIGVDGPHVLRIRLECEVTTLWSQVIGQDSSTSSAGNRKGGLTNALVAKLINLSFEPSCNISRR